MDLVLVIASTYLMTITSTMLPLLMTNSLHFPTYTKTAVKTAFFISAVPLTFFLNQGAEAITITLHWLPTTSYNLNLDLQFDTFSIIFTPIALFVTWNILEFSTWYMHSDPKMNPFFKYLLIFLLAMIILTTAGNMFILFIGWEGVGIMSFMLIGWYHARANAGTAALQAVLYNRIGDIGFFFAVAWLLTNSTSLDFPHLFSLPTNTPLLMAIIVAAASKSAQFGFHPWLASAMEGPTPVSALLHSSTMVVAGIYLLIRTHPLLQLNQTALSTCLCLGAITTSFAATSALAQNDIKKIIAYSTSSQLGLMLMAIGLNYPHLAFFHMCTHAFFKAMLFLCSGSIIHSLANEQDIRKMGGLQQALPVTTACITIGTLALAGTPYLAAFFSKDAIIEAASTSNTNMWALILTMIATSLTTMYSLRLAFFTSMNFPRVSPIVTINENNHMITNPLKRLAIGSITAGFLMFQTIIPINPMTHTMPTTTKLTALLVTFLAFFLALDLAKLSWSSHPPTLSTPLKHLDTAHLTLTLHRLLPTIFLNFGLRITSTILDATWFEKAGPKSLADLQLPPIKALQDAQKGIIKMYLSVFLITLALSVAT
uniref:NADH-ubiquinone oxidoreductase chain 5 n=1 Tax=Oreophryne sp. TNHC-GDC 18615 TaxID=1933078 RepID=A0A343VTF3_9NEOB|nr:NADH dehydrogenase subunit 5 [Oreophryne sp. TNHC-GDC 18615]